MLTANSVKFSSVTYKIFPSNTGEPSRSTFDAQSLLSWASISTRLREYDNILCPSLCWNDLSSQAPHKSPLLRENFKITFKLVLGHIRFVLMLVLHSAKSRDVTSLLKWVYTVLDCLKKITIPQKFQFLFLIQEADLTFTFVALINFNQTKIIKLNQSNNNGGKQLSHQNQMLTSNSNRSQQIQIAHSKFKSLTANYKSLTANYKSLTANSNRPQQIQIVHSKLKSLTANSNCSQQITFR